MMLPVRHALLTAAATAAVSVASCGGHGESPKLPNSPTPPVTANAYILPDAVSRGDFAFGDEPVVIHTGERLRWINVDTVTHLIVADSPGVTDFSATGELRPGGEQSFAMTRPGTTRIHCTIHPSMTGTLTVRDQ